MRATDLPLYYNAVDILERNLPERSAKIALDCDKGSLSFGEVSRRVNQVGHGLKSLGVRPGDCVALLAYDSPEWVETYFGSLKIGAVAASLNTLLMPDELVFMLNDCHARVLVGHATLLTGLTTVRSRLPYLEHVLVIDPEAQPEGIDYAQWRDGWPTELQVEQTHRDAFCCLNYSSGTTGEPKGILHAHKDLPLTAQLWGANVLGLTESDRTFAVAKLFFTFGTGGNLIFPWYVGASIVLYAGPPRIPINVLAQIDRYRPTILYNAPTGYAAMLAVEGFTEAYDLSSLRLCVSAGEALPAPVWHQWRATTGIEIIDGIGSTENYHIFISNRSGDLRPGSSGRPVPGYEVRIVDEQGQAVPQGQIGNLQVKGETAALFYLHQYAKSRQTFLGEWLHTGDKYYVDSEGYYWHAGRTDDMLKVGGIWVSPVEVESALLSHPAVQECAVVGRTDSAGLVKPLANVVLATGYTPSETLAAELITHCRETMAEYKRPRWVHFVDDLPKTSTGKIQRYRLRE